MFLLWFPKGLYVSKPFGVSLNQKKKKKNPTKKRGKKKRKTRQKEMGKRGKNPSNKKGGTMGGTPPQL